MFLLLLLLVHLFLLLELLLVLWFLFPCALAWSSCVCKTLLHSAAYSTLWTYPAMQSCTPIRTLGRSWRLLKPIHQLEAALVIELPPLLPYRLRRSSRGVRFYFRLPSVLWLLSWSLSTAISSAISVVPCACCTPLLSWTQSGSPPDYPVLSWARAAFPSHIYLSSPCQCSPRTIWCS